MNILASLCTPFSYLKQLSFSGVYLYACLVLSWGVHAEQNTTQKKQIIQLDYTNQSATQSPTHQIEQTTTNTAQSNEMKNGLIKIRRIQVQGDVLYPEFGFTDEFLFTRVNQVYSHMGELLSISDMNKIADALTLAYREKGLTFNQAYVIPQEIVDSTLTIHVLKGTLSEIEIYNNGLFNTNQLTEPFADLVGKVIYEPNIKKIVKNLSKKPGLKIFSFFSVGSKQGEARLNIKVMEETQHESKLIIDNKGVSQTGENR